MAALHRASRLGEGALKVHTWAGMGLGPGGMPFSSVMPKDTLAYYLFETLTALIFLAGVGGQVSFWLHGRGSPASGPWGRLGSFLRVSLAALGRGATWGRFVDRAILQRQIWRESRYRWLMHVGISWGAVELFFVGSLGNMAVDFHLVELSKDAPWFAALNDLGGGFLLLGIGMALWRRWVLRPHQLRSLEEDGLILLGLGLAALSGYFLEGTRLLSSPVWPSPQSFLGYGLALPLRGLALPWAEVWLWAWWGHVLFAFGLVAYVPYSKLFHIVTASYVVAVKPEELDPSLMAMVTHERQL